MLRRQLIAVAAGILLFPLGSCGPGDQAQTSRLQVIMSDDVITLTPGSRLQIYVMVAGAAADEPVTLTSPALPSFVQISGMYVHLQPTAQHAGDHDIPLTAKAGDQIAEATIRVHVPRANTAPFWMSWSTDKTGEDWSVVPWVETTACDHEFDDMTVSFRFKSGAPEQRFLISFDSDLERPSWDPECLYVRFEFEALTWSDLETLCMRLTDELGASSESEFTFEHGWKDPGCPSLN